MNFVTQKSIVIAGITISETTTLTDNLGSGAQPICLMGQNATLTVRTDTINGTLTMGNANHGITTGLRIDLYTPGTGTIRFGITAGTVSGNQVPLTLGGGAVLPSNGSSVVVGIPQSISVAFGGSNVTAIAARSPSGAGVMVFANGATDVANVTLGNGTLYSWATLMGTTNPLTGLSITTIYVSSFYNRGNATVSVGVCYH